MSSDINVVLLSGRLTTEPELRFTARGTPVTSLRLASSRYWKATDCVDGEYRKQSVFITVETFGKTAERIASSSHKGDALMIRGRLVYEEWADSVGGKRRNIKLFSDDITVLPSGRHAHRDGSFEALSVDPDEASAADSGRNEPAVVVPSDARKTSKETGKVHH